MNDLAETRNRGDRPLGAKRPKTERSRGQILILFVMAIFVFTGMVALVIDVSWYWVNSLRVQRAADAAALAGVVQLPTNPGGAGGAYDLAREEATKNGYDDASAAIVVTPVQQPAVTGRRLEVTVSAPVDMFFMRIFGINQINSTRVARAEFVLPVPMGSPDNWYGVFGPSRGFTSTTTNMVDVHTPSTGNSGLKVPTDITPTVPSTAAWAASAGNLITAVAGNNDVWAQTNTNARNQIWRDFDLLSGLAANQTATTVTGIQVRLTDAFVNLTCAGSFIQVALSYDGGLHWTTATANNRAPTTGSLTTTATTDYTLGSATAVTAWPLAGPVHTWTGNDLGNSNFRVRLTATKGPSPCTAATLLRVDMIQVQANYGIDTVTQTPVTTTTAPVDMPVEGPGTNCTTGVIGCYEADGQVLSPNGFWGTMNTEGAENVNGDVHQAYYDTEGGTINPAYQPNEFYNYAIEMPPGSGGGSVYVYDPGFCDTANNKGTGDRWFSGDGVDLVNSYYELYDTQGTLSDITDDGAPLVTSASMFLGMKGSDSTMGGSLPARPRSAATRRTRPTVTVVTSTTAGTFWRAGSPAARSTASTRPRRTPTASETLAGRTARTALPSIRKRLSGLPVSMASGRCRPSRRCRRRDPPSHRSSTWPRSTPSTPARPSRSSCGTRVTPAH